MVDDFLWFVYKKSVLWICRIEVYIFFYGRKLGVIVFIELIYLLIGVLDYYFINLYIWMRCLLNVKNGSYKKKSID